MHLLHASSDCCRLSPGGYGIKYGRLVTTMKGTPDAEGCFEHCKSTDTCAFFSHSTRYRKCILCSACELEAAPAFVVHEKTLQLSQMYTSWSMRPLAAFSSRSPPDDALMLALGSLQGEYSKRLYGKPGLVDSSTLRLVWLDLLPAAALEQLNTTGICGVEAAGPWRPFFTSIDLFTAPLDAVWISRRNNRPHALANHTWVEVAHCAQGRGWAEEGLSNPRPAWKCKPAWFYVAHGSGVSINVGRTIVVDDFIEASILLELAFPGDLTPGVAVPAGPADAYSRRTNRANGSEQVWWSPGHRTKRHARERQQAMQPPTDMSSIDSIQVLENWEWYSKEPRHELIMLRHREEDVLDASTPGLRCGKFPQLRSCATDPAALTRVSTCTQQRRHDRTMLKRLRHRGLQFRKPPCAADLPTCFRNGSRSEYECIGS